MNNKLGIMQGRLSPIYNNLIQSFPYLNWEKEFETANKLAFNHIEWTVDQFLIDMNPINYNDGLKKIQNIKKKTKIKIINLTADFFMQEPFFKSNKLLSQTLEKQLIKLIINSSKIGIKNFVVPLVDNGRIENETQKKTIVSFFRNIIPILKKNKIKIAFEIDLKPKQNMEFLDRIKSDLFGINFDMGNSASLGIDPKKEINLYKSRIFNVHIKDRLLHSISCPLGEGNVDFNSVFENLKLIGYSKYYTLQVARSHNNNHTEILKKARKFVLKYFNEN